MTWTIPAPMVTHSGLNEQCVFRCIRIQFAAGDLCLTDWNTDVYLTVGMSRVKFSPRSGGLEIGEVANGSGADSVNVKIACDPSVAGDLWGLDDAESAEELTATIYRVTRSSAGVQTQLTEWEGKVRGFALDGPWASFQVYQSMGWKSGPGNRIVSPICPFTAFKGELCQHDGDETECARTIGACVGMVHPPVFTGTGKNDITVTGPFENTLDVYDLFKLVVKINHADATKFDWAIVRHSDTYPPNSWDGTGVAITGAAQTLANGLSVTFPTSVGYTSDEYWETPLSNEEHFGGETSLPKAGDVLPLGEGVSVPASGDDYAGNDTNWHHPPGLPVLDRAALGAMGYAEK